MDCSHSFFPLLKQNLSIDSRSKNERQIPASRSSKELQRRSNFIEFYYAVQCNQCGLLAIRKDSTISDQNIQSIFFTPFINKPQHTKKKDESLFASDHFFRLLYEEIRMNSLLKSNLVKKEISPFYLNIRPKLVSYLDELVRDYEYSDRVLFHAIYIIDYVYCFGVMEFEEAIIEKENHFFIVLASFILSVKFVENDCVPPKLSYFDDMSKSVCGKRVSIKEVYHYEMAILELLQYKLDVCTIDFIIEGLFFIDFAVVDSEVTTSEKPSNLPLISNPCTKTQRSPDLKDFKTASSLDCYSPIQKIVSSTGQEISELLKLTREFAKGFIMTNDSLFFCPDEIAIACLLVAQELIFPSKSRSSFSYRQAIKVLFDTSVNEGCVEKLQIFYTENRKGFGEDLESS